MKNHGIVKNVQIVEKKCDTFPIGTVTLADATLLFSNYLQIEM